MPDVQREPARLEVDDITVAYNGHAVLQDVTFQVPHGARVAVAGPNGAGKSTLFKAMVGLLPLRKGRILVHGHPLRAHKECVAYVPQREEVDWHFPVTVGDVVMMGRYCHLGWLKLPTRADRAVVMRSLEQVGMAHLADERIGELSGGQQQRVFLARALAQEPHILLMDEPFTAVDITTQEAMLTLLEELQAHGVTVMVSTHDLNLAAARFDSILLINHRLIASGTAAEVLTPQVLSQTFGGQILFVDGAMVIDQCCPPQEVRR